MEPFLSDYLVIFQNLALPGFFYLLGFLVLIQVYLRIDVYKIIKHNNEYAIYIGILFIVISFIFGLTIYLAEQELKTLFIRKLDNVFLKEELQKKGYSESYSNKYCVLIMLRHLIISISFLVFSLGRYLKLENKKINNKWFFISIYFFVFLILTLAYFRIKELIDKMSTGESICWILILGVIALLFIISLLGISFNKTHLTKNKV